MHASFRRVRRCDSPAAPLGRPTVMSDTGLADAFAEAMRRSNCARPYEAQPGVFVRCQSRRSAVCPSCAAQYRGDWQRLARSGMYDADGQPVKGFRYYFITLSAPSFGAVHRAPTPCVDVRSRRHFCPKSSTLVCVGQSHGVGNCRVSHGLCDTEVARHPLPQGRIAHGTPPSALTDCSPVPNDPEASPSDRRSIPEWRRFGIDVESQRLELRPRDL